MMKFFAGLLALGGGLYETAGEETGPEQQLANMLMSAATGPEEYRGPEGGEEQYGYLGNAGENEFEPMVQFNVTKLIQLFGERMAEARSMNNEIKRTEDFSPVQKPEGYENYRTNSIKDYFCPICEDNAFYPYGRCKVSEKRYVANAASCEAYCESLVYNQVVTFMSYGGNKGKYAGLCICYRYKPYTKPVRCPKIGAASYPITVKNYFIDNGVCDFQFHAPDAAQCRKGCLLNAWYNGKPNAIYSYEGCPIKRQVKEYDNDYSYEKGNCDGYSGRCPKPPQWRPPRLAINCKCFWQVFKWSVCKRYGAQIGTAAPCQYLITGEPCNRCRKDGWKDDDCRNCKDYPYKKY